MAVFQDIGLDRLFPAHSPAAVSHDVAVLDDGGNLDSSWALPASLSMSDNVLSSDKRNAFSSSAVGKASVFILVDVEPIMAVPSSKVFFCRRFQQPAVSDTKRKARSLVQGREVRLGYDREYRRKVNKER